jgi:hypothetical protein
MKFPGDRVLLKGCALMGCNHSKIGAGLLAKKLRCCVEGGNDCVLLAKVDQNWIG